MGYKIILYDKNHKELLRLYFSHALIQKFESHSTRVVPIYYHPVEANTFTEDFDPIDEVESAEAFYAYSINIIKLRENPLYKKGANEGPIRVGAWGDPYFADKSFNHPPPSASDLEGFDVQAARLGMIEEQFYEIVKSSNDHPDGYWLFY